MFHPWRVLSFAALAAMVSFNLRAATEVATAEELAAAITGEATDDIKLIADIDCSAWTTCDFSGTLDGDGKTISGLTTALFGTLAGTAKNLVFDGAAIVCTQDGNKSGNTITYTYWGILATAINSGAVSNVRFKNCTMSTSGSGNAYAYFGLVAATATESVTVEDVVVETSCSLTGKQQTYFGGVFGKLRVTEANTARISRCAMAGAVSYGNYTTSTFGGLVNSVDVYGNGKGVTPTCFVEFEDCTNDTTIVAAKGNIQFGGIVMGVGGPDSSHMGCVTLSGCVNNGGISGPGGTGTNSGGTVRAGLVGSQTGAKLVLENCVNNGDILGLTGSKASDDKNTTCGGLVGSVTTPIKVPLLITGCVNKGKVDGATAGGFVGSYKQHPDYGNGKIDIKSSAQLGDVTVSSTAKGAVAAQILGWFMLSRTDKGSVAGELDVHGCLFSGDTSVGGVDTSVLADARIRTTVIADNVDILASTGLTDGTDLAALNAYEDCNLWKQGTFTPILKIMPDEFVGAVYLVTFVDWDDTVLGEIEGGVKEGEKALRPAEDPVREGYAFAGWTLNGELYDFDTPVTANLTLKAAYDINVYDVSFVDGVTQEPIGEVQKIEHGHPASAPAVPEHTGYLFAGWEPADFSAVTSNTTVVATYVEATAEFTVTFVDWDETVLKETTVTAGEGATPPADPTRFGYDFAGWSGNYEKVSENATVKATYSPKASLLISTPEEAAAVFSGQLDASTDCTLATNELDLSGLAVGGDFGGTLDGNGCRVTGFKNPLFGTLTGKVRNLVLDGLNDETGAKTSVNLAHTVDFGWLAVSIDGGEAADITVRNLEIKTGDNANVGLVAGRMRDGAALRNVTVEGSCTLRSKKTSAGGLVGSIGRTEAFAPTDASGKPVVGACLASICDSTNEAALVAYGGDGCLGGILGAADVVNATYQFVIVVSNCVNRGDFSATAQSNNSNLGGIVAQRSNNSSGAIGVLRLIGCANLGNVNSVGSNGNYGGIIGYAWRGSQTLVSGCVNRGSVGGSCDFNGSPMTGGSAGGIYGCLSNLYNGNPHVCLNSANYGNVTCGLYAGGIFGCIDGNSGHSHSYRAINCANYGAVSTVAEGGAAGEGFAAFLSVMGPGSCTVTISNCLFQTETVYGKIVE